MSFYNYRIKIAELLKKIYAISYCCKSVKLSYTIADYYGNYNIA